MTSDTPAFSVIVPTKDRPAMLARALRSILTQRDAEYEIIVADDGTGQGLAVARDLLGESCAGFETGALGQVPARNMALRRACGRWIAYLDDDDWWAHPDHLSALGAALRAGASLAYASGRIVRETAELKLQDEIPFTASIDAASIRRDNTLLIPGIAYDASLHDRLGLLDESFAVYWDWDWYLRLSAAGARFADAHRDGVRISARIDNVSAPGNEHFRATELRRLCEKHGLTGVVLKNHESIAVEQHTRAKAIP